MLSIKDLKFTYKRNTPPTLNGVNLELSGGEVGILLGKNGSGKTTLFKNILGILRPSCGEIRIDGEEILKMPGRERARLVAYVPQDIRFGALTVFDSVMMGRVSHFGLAASAEDYLVVERTLADMGLTEYALREVEKLSGGERQKVAIARAIAQEPRILVFDEPTGNLDIANERLIIEEAKRLAAERGIAVLIAMHDLNRALSLGDRFFFLKDGAITHSGGRDSVTEEVIFDTFGVRVRLAEVDGQIIVIEV